MELDGAPPAPEPEPAPQAGGFEGVRSIFFYNTEPEVGQVTGLNLFEYRPVQSKIRVPLFAPRTLNATGPSRVTLSLR